MKKNFDEAYPIAMIPFVRNMIEYTYSTDDKDYKTLTALLHLKEETNSITFGMLQEIYGRHWMLDSKPSFAEGRENDSVYAAIIKAADNIPYQEDISLHKKLLLSMAIRLKAEDYMISKIGEQTDIKKDQTREQYNRFKNSCPNTETLKVLDKVNLLTPSNIHVNSFMFEPILDMSILQLIKLYEETKSLNES